MSRRSLVRVGLVAGLVVLCEAVTRLGLVRRTTLVPPSEMLARLARLMGGTEFWSEAGFTAGNIVVAFVAAVTAGFVLAVALHQVPRARRAIEPLIASYYALPFFVLYPLFIVIFGMNARPIVCMGFLYAVMAMITGTLSGLDRIPRVYQRTGRIMRLGGVRQALLIQLPAAAPHVLTGLKLALGYAITGVIGSEFILSNNGLGYAIAFAYNNFDDTTMYALLVFVLTSVTAITLLLHAGEQGVTHRQGSGARDQRPGSAPLLERAAALAVIALVIVVIWQVLFRLVGSEALASPAMTTQRIASLWGRAEFWGNVTETMRAMGLALGLSCVAGALIGVMLGLRPAPRAVLEPLLVAFYAMPKVTLYPVILLFFGIGLQAKVAFGALYGMIPMILITLNAIATINPALLRTGQVMRLGRMQTLLTVILPSTVPELVSGLRISFSITLLGVMIGEMFASRRGLGFMIMNSMGVNDTATMMAVTVLVGTFAVVMNRFLTSLDSRLLGQRGARRNEAQPVQG